MDEFQDGLGTAFATDAIDFECEATSINDHDEFFKMIAGCGFEVEGYEAYAKKKEPADESNSQEKSKTEQPTLPKIPTLNELIQHQHSYGPWKAEARKVLELFIVGGLFEDVIIGQLLKEAMVSGSQADPNSIVLTIVALFVLNEVFSDQKDQWQLLAKKAKEFLKR